MAMTMGIASNLPGSPHDSLSPQDGDVAHFSQDGTSDCKGNRVFYQAKTQIPVIQLNGQVTRSKRPPALHLTRSNGFTTQTPGEIRRYRYIDSDNLTTVIQIPRIIAETLPPTPDAMGNTASRDRLRERINRHATRLPPGPRRLVERATAPRQNRDKLAKRKKKEDESAEPPHVDQNQSETSSQDKSTNDESQKQSLSSSQDKPSIDESQNQSASSSQDKPSAEEIQKQSASSSQLEPLLGENQDTSSSMYSQSDSGDRFEQMATLHQTLPLIAVDEYRERPLPSAPVMPVSHFSSSSESSASTAARQTGTRPSSQGQNAPQDTTQGSSTAAQGSSAQRSHAGTTLEERSNERDLDGEGSDVESANEEDPSKRGYVQIQRAVIPPPPTFPLSSSSPFKSSGYAKALPVNNTMRYCFRKHIVLHPSSNKSAPVECAACHNDDEGKHYTCSWCCLRICEKCRQDFDRAGLDALLRRIAFSSAERQREAEAAVDDQPQPQPEEKDHQ